MKILAAIAALFAFFSFLGHEVLSILILAWLVLAALGIFICAAWIVGHVVVSLYERI